LQRLKMKLLKGAPYKGMERKRFCEKNKNTASHTSTEKDV